MPPVSPAPAPRIAPPTTAASSRPLPERVLRALFKLFSSVRLAVFLLSVLIVGSIAGTLYESTFDAKVARAYVYEAWWFNFWLLFLGLNLFCAALSRWPWKRHHTGFLITHLGIITLLIGSYVGRTWGIEGTMTLFKDRPPNNQLVIDQKILHLQQDGARSLAWPVEIIGRKPSAIRPWNLGKTAGGYKIDLVDYAPSLAATLEPKPVDDPAAKPAVHLRLASARLGQTMDRWLLADENAENSTLDLGMAAVRLRPLPKDAPAGDPAASSAPSSPEAAKPAPGTVNEAIMVFAQKPGEQVARAMPGTTPSGTKLALSADMNGRRLSVTWRGATYEFDPVADKGKDEELGSGSGMKIRIENFWPDFELKDGKPVSLSDVPRNPAVLVTVFGLLPAAAESDSPLATEPAPVLAGNNQALVFVAPDGSMTYELRASATAPPVKGVLKPGEAINTGWADWTLTGVESIPRAVEFTKFSPAPEKKGGKMDTSKFTEGLRVRVSKDGDVHEEWVPGGWRVSLPTKPRPVLFTYGFRLEPLPIGLELVNFEVERNEGNDSPAGFKSTVRVTDREGGNATGDAYMNHPFNYPEGIPYTFSGLTYKVSQASWNPENLNQSSVQILRDPGWSMKWIGSILICIGIFALFYLRPAPKFATVAGAAAGKPKKK
jgi:hypothetical protein